MNIDTLLPESGTGFVTNNRGPAGKNQFGQQSSIDAALAVGASWNVAHADRPFSIGQISRRGGGPMPPHKSHRLGVDIDVRPMRTDGLNQGVTITDGKYDRAMTTELIDLWWTKAPVHAVFFNDPTVIAAGLSREVERCGLHRAADRRRFESAKRHHDFSRRFSALPPRQTHRRHWRERRRH